MGKTGAMTALAINKPGLRTGSRKWISTPLSFEYLSVTSDCSKNNSINSIQDYHWLLLVLLKIILACFGYSNCVSCFTIRNCRRHSGIAHRDTFGSIKHGFSCSISIFAFCVTSSRTMNVTTSNFAMNGVSNAALVKKPV